VYRLQEPVLKYQQGNGTAATLAGGAGFFPQMASRGSDHREPGELPGSGPSSGLPNGEKRKFPPLCAGLAIALPLASSSMSLSR